MSFFGLFGGDSSSSSSTRADVTQDNRLATGDVGGQVTAPGGVLANPLSAGGVVSGQGKLDQTVSYGTVNMGLSESGTNSLVNRLMSGSEKIAGSLADLQMASSKANAATAGSLTDIIASSKGEGSSASRYLPYAIVAGVLLYLYLTRKA